MKKKLFENVRGNEFRVSEGGDWNDNAEEVLRQIKEVETSISQLYQKVASITSNASKKPTKKELQPVWSNIINAGHKLQDAAHLLKQIWAPDRKPRPDSPESLAWTDPGRTGIDRLNPYWDPGRTGIDRLNPHGEPM